MTFWARALSCALASRLCFVARVLDQTYCGGFWDVRGRSQGEAHSAVRRRDGGKDVQRGKAAPSRCARGCQRDFWGIVPPDQGRSFPAIASATIAAGKS
jgi:hypothetical protein